MKKVSSLVAGIAILAAVVGGQGVAEAHAIISLNGTDAYAGKTSAMTLEIQHGCLTGTDGVIQVVAIVGRPWGLVRPRPVEGWTVRRTRISSGQQLTWTKQGVPQAFNVPVYLPVQVTWPKTPGVYGMKVTQACPSGVTSWNVIEGPATANAPSPPLTPLPQVLVKAVVKAS